MVEEITVNITEDEAALYDRQIRLWGLDAQKRLRAARVLLIGLGGLGAEVAKNIVLSGVKSITLLDHQLVTNNDSTSQFLFDKTHIGQNRASCSQLRTQLLNPMVEVRVDNENSETKPEEFFKSFDVVCATCCTLVELLRLDDICTRNNVAFFAGDVFGYYSFMFANLHEHEYADDVVVHGKADHQAVTHSGHPPAKKLCTEDDKKKTVKKICSFTPLKNAINFEWNLEENAKKLKLAPKAYFIARVLLEFRVREGRDPESEHAEADRAKLKQLKGEVLTSLGVPVDHLDDEYCSNCLAALSPVCAITGGVLAQEIIKAVSQRDPPHNNFFFYNGTESSGLVDRIG